jgi:hypothetical protein
MDENPYCPPTTVSDGNRGSRWIALAVAMLMAVAGLYMAFGVAYWGLQAVKETGFIRNFAIYQLPAYATAATGCLLASAGIARGQKRMTAVGGLLFVVGVGGWCLYMVGNVAGWWSL